jgi:hypothetical protein
MMMYGLFNNGERAGPGNYILRRDVSFRVVFDGRPISSSPATEADLACMALSPGQKMAELTNINPHNVYRPFDNCRKNSRTSN